MDMNNSLITFKAVRLKKRKKHISCTLVVERFETIKASISEKGQFFGMLTKSEQMDFMLYMLETYMNTDERFNIVPVDHITGD